MTVTLITGANRGIGFETATQLVQLGHTVYIGARDAQRGADAAAAIGARAVQLDVTDDDSVAAALATVDAEAGGLDLLINNAGIMAPALDGPTALRVFDINAVGIVRVTEAALPLLRKSADPAVVTISSSMGSFWATTTPERPESHLQSAFYAASKAAATMLTVQYWFNLLSAAAGMVGLTLSGGLGLPVSWLEGSPFHSYVWPGVVLGLVVGGVQALALLARYARYRLAWRGGCTPPPGS